MKFTEFSKKVSDGDIKLEEPKTYEVDTSRDLRYVAESSLDRTVRKARIDNNLT